MRIFGRCLAGGPLNVQRVPIPIDPTLHHVVPAPPVRPKRTPTPKRRSAGPLSAEAKAAMVAQRAEGVAAKALAVRYGVAPSTVFKVIADARKATA